jgi:predicted GNAT family acetyltransferase
VRVDARVSGVGAASGEYRSGDKSLPMTRGPVGSHEESERMVEQQSAPQSTRVVRNEDQHRYEVYRGPELAGFSVYTERADEVVFIHTEIGPEFGGQGLGSVLAEHAVRDVIAGGRMIVARCPFIAAYLDKHPEYDAHVVGKGASR